MTLERKFAVSTVSSDDESIYNYSMNCDDSNVTDENRMMLRSSTGAVKRKNRCKKRKKFRVTWRDERQGGLELIGKCRESLNLNHDMQDYNSDTNSVVSVRKDPYCNCIRKKDCPLSNMCLYRDIGYRVVVYTEEEGSRVFYGATHRGTFKQHYYALKHAIKNVRMRYASPLVKHLRHLKQNNISFTLTFQPVFGKEAASIRRKRSR